MSLDETVLQRLSEWRVSDGRQTLAIAGGDAGWTVAVTADQADALGCLVWELLLRQTSAASTSSLQHWADLVAQRATGLLEALKVVEVDRLRNEALLRSQEPPGRGGDVFYYEVLLKGAGAVGLRRYHAHRDGNVRREQIAFAVTHEAIAKLSRDLTAND